MNSFDYSDMLKKKYGKTQTAAEIKEHLNRVEDCSVISTPTMSNNNSESFDTFTVTAPYQKLSSESDKSLKIKYKNKKTNNSALSVNVSNLVAKLSKESKQHELVQLNETNSDSNDDEKNVAKRIKRSKLRKLKRSPVHLDLDESDIVKKLRKKNNSEVKDIQEVSVDMDEKLVIDRVKRSKLRKKKRKSSIQLNESELVSKLTKEVEKTENSIDISQDETKSKNNNKFTRKRRSSLDLDVSECAAELNEKSINTEYTSSVSSISNDSQSNYEEKIANIKKRRKAISENSIDINYSNIEIINAASNESINESEIEISHKMYSNYENRSDNLENENQSKNNVGTETQDENAVEIEIREVETTKTNNLTQSVNIEIEKNVSKQPVKEQTNASKQNDKSNLKTSKKSIEEFKTNLQQTSKNKSNIHEEFHNIHCTLNEKAASIVNQNVQDHSSDNEFEMIQKYVAEMSPIKAAENQKVAQNREKNLDKPLDAEDFFTNSEDDRESIQTKIDDPDLSQQSNENILTNLPKQSSISETKTNKTKQTLDKKNIQKQKNNAKTKSSLSEESTMNESNAHEQSNINMQRQGRRVDHTTVKEGEKNHQEIVSKISSDSDDENMVEERIKRSKLRKFKQAPVQLNVDESEIVKKLKNVNEKEKNTLEDILNEDLSEASMDVDKKLVDEKVKQSKLREGKRKSSINLDESDLISKLTKKVEKSNVSFQERMYRASEKINVSYAVEQDEEIGISDQKQYKTKNKKNNKFTRKSRYSLDLDVSECAAELNEKSINTEYTKSVSSISNDLQSNYEEKIANIKKPRKAMIGNSIDINYSDIEIINAASSESVKESEMIITDAIKQGEAIDISDQKQTNLSKVFNQTSKGVESENEILSDSGEHENDRSSDEEFDVKQGHKIDISDQKQTNSSEVSNQTNKGVEIENENLSDSDEHENNRSSDEEFDKIDKFVVQMSLNKAAKKQRDNKKGGKHSVVSKKDLIRNLRQPLKETVDFLNISEGNTDDSDPEPSTSKKNDEPEPTTSKEFIQSTFDQFFLKIKSGTFTNQDSKKLAKLSKTGFQPKNPTESKKKMSKKEAKRHLEIISFKDNMETLEHYLHPSIKLTKEAKQSFHSGVEQFWENLMDDIDVVLTAKNKKEDLTKKDFFKILKGVGVVNNMDEMNAWLMEMLPNSLWSEVMPIERGYGLNPICKDDE